MKSADYNPQAACYALPDYVNTRTLVANTNQNETPPAGAKFVVINVTASAQFKLNGAASQAAASDGSGSFFVNVGDDRASRTFYIGDATSIGCISTGTPGVSFSYYGG